MSLFKKKKEKFHGYTDVMEKEYDEETKECTEDELKLDMIDAENCSAQELKLDMLPVPEPMSPEDEFMDTILSDPWFKMLIYFIKLKKPKKLTSIGPAFKVKPSIKLDYTNAKYTRKELTEKGVIGLVFKGSRPVFSIENQYRDMLIMMSCENKNDQRRFRSEVQFDIFRSAKDDNDVCDTYVGYFSAYFLVDCLENWILRKDSPCIGLDDVLKEWHIKERAFVLKVKFSLCYVLEFSDKQASNLNTDEIKDVIIASANYELKRILEKEKVLKKIRANMEPILEDGPIFDLRGNYPIYAEKKVTWIKERYTSFDTSVCRMSIPKFDDQKDTMTEDIDFSQDILELMYKSYL